MKENIDILNVHHCVVKDENGVAIARLHEEKGFIRVERFASCSLGMYFYLLSYLRDLGWEVR